MRRFRQPVVASKPSRPLCALLALVLTVLPAVCCCVTGSMPPARDQATLAMPDCHGMHVVAEQSAAPAPSNTPGCAGCDYAASLERGQDERAAPLHVTQPDLQVAADIDITVRAPLRHALRVINPRRGPPPRPAETPVALQVLLLA